MGDQFERLCNLLPPSSLPFPPLPLPQFKTGSHRHSNVGKPGHVPIRTFFLLETLSQKIIVYGNQHIQMRGRGKNGGSRDHGKGGEGNNCLS